MVEEADAAPPEPVKEQGPSEADRRLARQANWPPPAPTVMTLLEGDDEQFLGLDRIRLDRSGYLCDRVTGREIMPRDGARAEFRSFDIEQPSPGCYRIRSPEYEAVFLNYEHDNWYYHREDEES